jgi:hypothetical protein
MPFSQTSLLVMRRIRGLVETFLVGNSPRWVTTLDLGMNLATVLTGGQASMSDLPEAEYLRIEPPFQIILDEKVIGTMEPLTKLSDVELARYSLPPPPVEESSQFEIQAGYHTLRIEAKRPFYKTVASDNQSFDIAPGETVRIFCQYAQAGLNKGIWRPFIGPYKHKIVLQRE